MLQAAPRFESEYSVQGSTLFGSRSASVSQHARRVAELAFAARRVLTTAVKSNPAEATSVLACLGGAQLKKFIEARVVVLPNVSALHRLQPLHIQSADGLPNWLGQATSQLN